MSSGSDNELIARLPRTFGPALNDQLHRWNFLFPAEQRLIRAQLEWLKRLSGPDFNRLFDPILEIEAQMDLPRSRHGVSTMTIEDSAIIARSPLYPEWRSRVEKAFESIDAGAEASGSLKRVRRLIICLLPAGLPTASQSLWPDLEDQLSWIRLDKPFGEIQASLASLVVRHPIAGLEPLERAWALECGSGLSDELQGTGATVLSWRGVEEIRREFSNRLNTIRKTLKSADETSEELRRIDLKRLLAQELYSQPAVREFVRSLLLSGNGGLVFNNSFVQWGAAETLRRVQPQVLFAYFGVRAKPKPFSGIVLFEDQHRSNPVADEPDLAGSLIDGMMLSQYVYLAAQRLAPYHDRTLTILAVADLDRIAVLAPTEQHGRFPDRKVSGAELTARCLAWLGVTL